MEPTIPAGSTYPMSEGNHTCTVMGYDTGLEVYIIERDDGHRFPLPEWALRIAMSRPDATLAGT